MTIDWRDHPDGFIGVCEDADISVHIAQDAATASLDDAIRTTPVFSGSLHAYLTDIDSNPGFYETFGSENTAGGHQRGPPGQRRVRFRWRRLRDLRPGSRQSKTPQTRTAR